MNFSLFVNFFNASQSQLVAVLHCLNKWRTENFSINSYAVLNWVSSYWIFHLPRENFLLPELSFICISDIQAPHWSRVQLSVSDWLNVTRLIPLYLVWWWLSPGVLHSLTHTICHTPPLEHIIPLIGIKGPVFAFKAMPVQIEIVFRNKTYSVCYTRQ